MCTADCPLHRYRRAVESWSPDARHRVVGTKQGTKPLACSVVAIPPDPDGPLALSRRRLADCVHSLVDEIPVWEQGIARWSESVYARLRGALVARTARSRAVAGSRLPCRVDVLTLLVEIDRVASEWEPDGKGTVERLRQLAAHGWRPQDCELIDGYCGQIERWGVAAAELLGDRAPAVALRLPCPSCGEQFVYRRSGGGESVRSWALRVSETGCECSVCRAFWGPDQFEWLAKLLGCAPLPGAS